MDADGRLEDGTIEDLLVKAGDLFRIVTARLFEAVAGPGTGAEDGTRQNPQLCLIVGDERVAHHSRDLHAVFDDAHEAVCGGEYSGILLADIAVFSQLTESDEGVRSPDVLI